VIEKRPLVEGGPVTRTILHCHAGAGIDVPHQKGVVVQRDVRARWESRRSCEGSARRCASTARARTLHRKLVIATGRLLSWGRWRPKGSRDLHDPRVWSYRARIDVRGELDPAAPADQCPQPVKADVRAQETNTGFDPSATLAVHCGDGFDARVEPI
jgi:hypothetical protein